MTNIVINGVTRDLWEFLTAGLDMERVYAVYWEQRKAAHRGKLPSALDHESWEAFCGVDPDSATEFIGPFREAMLSLTERGDVQEFQYDLVPTGSWLPRQQITVTEPLALYRERKPAGRVEILFSTERNAKE